MNLLNRKMVTSFSLFAYTCSQTHIYLVGMEVNFHDFEVITSSFFTQRYLLSYVYDLYRKKKSETVVQGTQKSLLAEVDLYIQVFQRL